MITNSSGGVIRRRSRALPATGMVESRASVSYAVNEALSRKRSGSADLAIQGGPMAVRHIVTIWLADGRADDFARAFAVLQAIALEEEGCEQYELFQSLDEPDKMVLLERWETHAALDQHMQAERTANQSAIDALVALWAPGIQPTVERFEV